VVNLLGEPAGDVSDTAARMIFTSGKPHRLNEALVPFFGGRVLA
jgi:glutamate racemase